MECCLEIWSPDSKSLIPFLDHWSFTVITQLPLVSRTVTVRLELVYISIRNIYLYVNELRKIIYVSSILVLRICLRIRWLKVSLLRFMKNMFGIWDLVKTLFEHIVLAYVLCLMKFPQVWFCMSIRICSTGIMAYRQIKLQVKQRAYAYFDHND